MRLKRHNNVVKSDNKPLEEWEKCPNCHQPLEIKCPPKIVDGKVYYVRVFCPECYEFAKENGLDVAFIEPVVNLRIA